MPIVAEKLPILWINFSQFGFTPVFLRQSGSIHVSIQSLKMSLISQTKLHPFGQKLTSYPVLVFMVGKHK